MAKPSALRDWTLVQSFLAVAEIGSLTGAAALLGRSQPTLGRQVQALEDQLGTALFERHPRGLRLSEAGAALLPHARAMRDAGQALELTAAGRAGDLSGTVRITASVYLSHYVLPPIVAGLRRALPDVQVELVASDASDSLHFREADIAVRMYRPTQPDIIARHLTDIPIGAFAARSYLDRAGRPRTLRDLFGHDLVGFDRNDLILRTMHELGWPADRETFAVRCDNQATYFALVRAGCGIGFSQVPAVTDDPDLEPLPLNLDLPPLPVWLAAHEKMRRTPRVGRVWDILAEHLVRLGRPATDRRPPAH